MTSTAAREARRWLRLAVCIAMVPALVGGCSSGGAHVQANPSAALREEAKAAGADQSQLDILAKPPVAYADYETAMTRGFECMRSAGFTVDVKGTRRQSGVTALDYTVSGATPAMDLASSRAKEIMLDCEVRFSRFVAVSWTIQSPDAVAYFQRREKALKPELVACLRAHAVDVAADSSFHDLISKSTTLAQTSGSVDCMSEIGYQGWDG